MASIHARQRDPLLDQNTQALLERRGRELLGIAMLFIAFAFALMLGSHSADDPGWMVATEEPARNLLGRFGAAVSSTLMIIGGKGTWMIPLILGAWGLRFVTHRGADRAVGRNHAVEQHRSETGYRADVDCPERRRPDRSAIGHPRLRQASLP